MNGRYLRYTNTTPLIRVFAWDTTTAAPVTSLTNSNTVFTTTRGTADTVHSSMVSATLGTWVSNGFVHRGAGVYDWYCPVSVNATGVDSVDVRASTLPAGVTITPFTVALGADDLTTAAPTDATVATAVDAVLADNFAAIPSASAIASAVAAPSAATIAAAVWSASTRELTAISATIRDAIADSLLGRTIAGAASGGRTVTSALRAIRNRVARSGATLTIYAEDDATVAYTAALTTDTNAAPITSIDPS